MRTITELDEMKCIQLDIMRKIHSYCKANDIRYYLSHGTLIGAIRHHGFIPWDDDIDIFMPRPDYERFCKEFPVSRYDNVLQIANSHTSPYYGRPMSKVYDTRTVLIEPNYLGDDSIGVNIDIWPLDGMPDDEKKRLIHLRKIKMLQMVLYGRVVKYSQCKGATQKIGHLFLLPISSKAIVRVIEKALKEYEYDQSTFVSSCTDPYKKFFKREWFIESMEVKSLKIIL